MKDHKDYSEMTNEELQRTLLLKQLAEVDEKSQAKKSETELKNNIDSTGLTPATKLWLATIIVPFVIWIFGLILSTGDYSLASFFFTPLALFIGGILFIVSLVVTLIGAGVKTGNKNS